MAEDPEYFYLVPVPRFVAEKLLHVGSNRVVAPSLPDCPRPVDPEFCIGIRDRGTEFPCVNCKAGLPCFYSLGA